MKRFLGAIMVTLVLFAITPSDTQAQCAMCSLTAENATEHGNTQGKGLNKGILFLLAIPYLAAVGIGVLWYKKYRSKKTVNVDNDPIVLN
ncbi:hypothetical protein JHJ32_17570 [Parapedobacter sp. ISTM3]|nr:hypothetical protein [Parapedobacter sp. ISTM3]